MEVRKRERDVKILVRIESFNRNFFFLMNLIKVCIGWGWYLVLDIEKYFK